MVLTFGFELLFLEALNTSWIYPITSKVCFVKGLANFTLTYIPNMIHICPNIYLGLYLYCFTYLCMVIEIISSISI